MRWSIAAFGALVIALPGATAQAAAPAPPVNPCTPAPVTGILAATTRLGVVDLHFFHAQGATVTYFECVDHQAYRLGERSLVATNGPLTTFYAATLWRCGRLTRNFVATATLADGSFSRGTSGVRTVSCADRFKLETPRRLARGRRARVRVVDRWGVGDIRLALCITSPRKRRTCRTVALKAASVAIRHFRATTRGHWRVELRVPRHRERAWIAVGVRSLAAQAPLPTVLATGDSSMQGIDSFLADELAGEAKVVGDARAGFAISRANGWGPIARSQAARLRPSTTVWSIGAAEGFPMRGADGAMHECCDEQWVAEYTRRLRTTLLTYRRGGRARVFSMTIPLPREAKRVPIFSAVNTAIVRAAEGLAGVRVLRMDTLFTPEGFREVMPYQGRDVRVRAPDGIHLNVSGTAIAARAVAQAMREP